MAINLACSVPGDECTEPGGTVARGLCSKHYQQWRKSEGFTRAPLVKLTQCSVNDAECPPPGGQIVKGMCLRHYTRVAKTGKTALPERPTTCSVANGDCSPPGGRLTRGLCSAHYQRARKNNGDPLAGERKRAPNGALLQFVLDATAYEGDGCLLWPFWVNHRGYGYVDYEGKRYGAHRLVLILTEGEPPEPDMEAAHAPGICHKRRCINPAHLRWATYYENRDDMLIDDSLPMGEVHSAARLRAEDIHQIRHVDQRSNYELSLVYDCTPANIWAIRNYKSWKHLP